MALRVSGKNLDIGDALRERVATRVDSALGRFFSGGYTGHVTVGRDGSGFQTECVVHLDSGVSIHTKSGAQDAYASADEAADRLERRLSRYKSRLKDRSAAQERETAAQDANYYVIESPADDDVHVDEFNPVIVAESVKSLKTLSVSEAVVELDLTGLPVVTFRHAGNGRVNLVYRRHDGNIGWIDPAAETPAETNGKAR